MPSRKCTAKITNKGRRFVSGPISGKQKWATLLEVRIVDDETGEALTETIVHLAEKDTLTLVGFYEKK